MTDRDSRRRLARVLVLLAVVAGLVLVAVEAGCDTAGDGAAAPGPAPGPRPVKTGGAQNGGGAPPSVPPPQWVEVSVEAGVTAENHSGKPLQKDWVVSGMGGGAMAFDYDNDGDVDLMVVDGTMLTSEGVLEYDDEWRTRLYRNEGAWRFTDVTKEAGIDVQAFGFGGATCDYDADGDQDVYICTWGRNFLLRNNGDGTFSDVTEEAGLLGKPDDMSTACAWGDLNGDGVHDVYVANYLDQWAQIRDFAERGQPGRSCLWRDNKVYCGPPGLPRQMDRLYLGNGDGTFREVTETNLKQQTARYAFTPIMTDVDDDGDLDIYVANDTLENALWVNDGEGVFIDRGRESGVATDGDTKQQAGMGVDAADVNRDGRIDLFVTNFSHDYNTLHLNETRAQDRPLFLDRTHLLNVAKLSYLRLCWGTRLFDMDNDGDLDMFVACGHVYGAIDNFSKLTGTSYAQRNLMLRNQGAPRYRFEDVTDDSGPAFEVKRVWRGACFADFDDDGDQDIFVSALNGKPALYRNDNASGNAFLRFRLDGTGGQRDPAGARVYVHQEGGPVLVEELHHGESFCSDNDDRLFFGLGAAESVPKVVVRWPGGDEETFENVKTRAFYRVKKGAGKLESDGEPTRK